MENSRPVEKKCAGKVWPSDGRPIPAWRFVLAEIFDLGPSSQSPAAPMLGGMLFPLILVWLGWPFILGKAVRLYGRDGRFIPGPPLEITGPAGIAFGILILSGALFLHFHYFWPARNEWVCAVGKAFSLFCGLGATLRFAWGVVVFLA